MILGAVGTGKTSACMYPYVDQLLRWKADDPARKLGGLVLEVKGQDNQEQQTKRDFLDEWIRAVNGHGGFGTWVADVSRHPGDVREILAKHGRVELQARGI